MTAKRGMRQSQIKMDTRNIISCHHHHQCELMNIVSGSVVLNIYPPLVLTLSWMSSPLYLPRVVLIKAFESKHCSLADVHTSSPFQNQSSLTLYGITPYVSTAFSKTALANVYGTDAYVRITVSKAAFANVYGADALC